MKEPPVIDCVPELVIERVLVPIPQELVQIWKNPAVPNSGDNAALLDWAQACAVTTVMYERQTKKLREIK